MTQIQKTIKDLKFRRSSEFSIIKNINEELGVDEKFSIEWIEDDKIGSILNQSEFSNLTPIKGYQSKLTTDAEDLFESDFLNNTFYLFQMDNGDDNFWYVIFQSVNGFEEIEFKLKVAEELKEFVSVGAINIFNNENGDYSYITSIYPHIS